MFCGSYIMTIGRYWVDLILETMLEFVFSQMTCAKSCTEFKSFKVATFLNRVWNGSYKFKDIGFSGFKN